MGSWERKNRAGRGDDWTIPKLEEARGFASGCRGYLPNPFGAARDQNEEECGRSAFVEIDEFRNSFRRFSGLCEFEDDALCLRF